MSRAAWLSKSCLSWRSCRIVSLEVRDALMTLESAREQVEIAKRGLEAAASEQELARERFSVLSSSSNLEITNALFSSHAPETMSLMPCIA